MRGLISAVVVRPVTTAMFTITVVLFGLVAALRLPVELLPELSYPTLTIRTVDPDAVPAEVEELLTRPIEERVGAVPGVIKVESVSREGQSDVVLDFAWGTSMDKAMANVREKLDRVTLPTTSERPLLLRYDPSQEPIMRLALHPTAVDGPLLPADLAVMREAADRFVKRELEKLSGVAAVEIHGGELEEIVVELDQARLDAFGVTSEEIVSAIARDNVNRPGGAINERDNRYLIRTLHEAQRPEDFADIIVRRGSSGDLRLGQLAKVSRAPIEQEELSLVNGIQAVELAVYREGDSNLVTVARAISARVSHIPLPAGYKLEVLSNQADFIESSVREVIENTIVGGVLAVLVLLFFLRDLRATLIIAAAIPISLLAAFVPMAALGVSLNIMSLGGLALGVGMLVDNSIVVLESIDRVAVLQRRSGGFSRRAAAVTGTTEVAASVVASTITTVAVFLPMAFVEGIAGQLVRDLSLAVSLSIASSMLVSLTLVPVLQGLGSHATADHPTTIKRSLAAVIVTAPLTATIAVLAVLVRLVQGVLGVARPVLSFAVAPLERTYLWIEARYPRLVGHAVRHPGTILGLAFGLCVITLPLADRYGQTLLPELEQREIFVQVTLPQGTALQRTTDLLRSLGAAIANDPAVELNYARSGSITQAASAGGSVTGSHLGQLDIRLLPDLHEPLAVIENRLLSALHNANTEPAAELQLGRPSLISFGAPLEIRLFGEDARSTTATARELLPALTDLDDLVDITPDDLEGRPEVRVDFDRERLGRVGVSVDEASAALSRAIQGEVATVFHASDRQLDVRVRLPVRDRSSADDISSVQVGTTNGVPIRIDAVAAVTQDRGPAEIRRIDGRRGLRIRTRVNGVNLAGVAAQVQTALGRVVPAGGPVTATIAGQAGELEASLRSIAFTAALSLFLVYVVMAATFESLRHPLIILTIVPLAASGVALACVLAKLPLSAMVGIGAIVLAGIVVNNAIVLIAAINDRRGAGQPLHESVIEAGRVRLRPIVMSTATTVLGLIPMAMGMGPGAGLRQPLAVTVIGGLSLSTLLTLVVIPAAYVLFPGPVRDAWKEPGSGAS